MPRLLVLAALVGCSGNSKTGSQSTDSTVASDTQAPALVSPAEVFESLGQMVILPDYRAFSEGTSTAATAAGAFCAAPDAATLAPLREAWLDLRRPWKHAETLRFGPYREEPWRVGPAVDAWPGDAETYQSVLDDDGEVDVSLYGTTRKGMHAIEWLIWERGEGTVAAFSTEDGAARRCQLLVALSDELAREAGVLLAAWDPDQQDWLAQLTAAGTVPVPDGDAPFFEDEDEAFSELANRLIFAVEDTRLMRLAAPFGELDGLPPQPALVESLWSGRSRQDALDVLAGVRRYVLGDGGQGLIDLLPPDDREGLRAAFEAAWTNANDAVTAIPEPLSTAISEDPASLRAALQALTELQVVLQVDMAQAWQITVRFNDNDGD